MTDVLATSWVRFGQRKRKKGDAMLSRRAFVRLGLGLGVVGLAGTYAYWLVGCWPKRERLALGSDLSDAVIGVVRTRTDVKDTRVHYLSRDLGVVGSVSIDRANVGNGWADTCVAGSKVVLPVDLSKSVPESTKVLCLDVATQDLTTWKVGNPWCVAANDTHVFASENGLTAAFTSIDSGSGATVSREVPNEINEALLWYDGSLWAANVSWSAGELILHRFSEDVGLQGSMTLGLPGDADGSVAGVHVNNMAARDGYLYLSTSGESTFGTAVPWGRICRYDIASAEYAWIETAEGYTQTLCFAGDTFAVLHSGMSAGVPRVCTYDRDGQLLARSEALPGRPQQMVVVGDVAYVTDDNEVRALNLDTLEVIGNVAIGDEGGYGTNTGLFAMP